MEKTQKGGFRGALGSIWRGIDSARRVVLNLIFILLLLFLLALPFGGGSDVPAKAALVLAPKGPLVEQLAGNPTDRAFKKLVGDDQPETLIYDVLDAIAAAKDDDRIQAILLDLDGLTGGHLDKLQRVTAALEDFKASGKKVIAAADVYGKAGYLVATAADEIHMHSMGMVLLDGYGRYRSYHRDLIDKLEVDWNVFKVGEYKSAVEPYLRNDMSDEAREANAEWMGDIWRSYVEHVAANRNLTPEEINDSIERLGELLQEVNGDTGQMALSTGLVDQIGDRDLVRARMIELVGEDEDGNSFARVGMETYLEDLGEERRRWSKDGDGVAVVLARGAIRDGSHPPGTIGGDSTAKLIRQAREDDSVKAIVLRVDSGGGSAFASEIIRREFILAREAGKKVVVSMGSVAASGGYWISTASDEIWASPNTITGSIGIFGMFPTYQKPLAKHLGTRVDGVGTTWLAGAFRPDRELDPRVGDMIQQIIDKGYQEFLDRVSLARGMPVAEVDKIARGRVWSGADAHQLGLVDQLGDLEQAIASAASLAGLEDGYAVRFIEKELEFKDKLLVDMLATARAWAGDLGFGGERGGLANQLIDTVRGHQEFLDQFDDPRGVYAHCLCEIE